MQTDLNYLPVEILHDILTYIIHGSKERLNILCVNSLFHSVALRILHQDLLFTSASQLMRFAGYIYHILLAGDPENDGHGKLNDLVCEPQTLTLELAGGTAFTLVTPIGGIAGFGTATCPLSIFECLHEALSQLARHPKARMDSNGKHILETLYLRLNSHSIEKRCYNVYDAFVLVNPRRFIWVGPDPPHHFSIAIVPNAVPSLFEALSTYTRLTYLKLTNIAFPTLAASDVLSTVFSSLSLSSNSGSESSIDYIRLPVIPSLRTLYLGQTTFLSAPSIASLILNTVRYSEHDDDANAGRKDPQSTTSTTRAQLERVHLVDAYEGSIWGLRLRMPHIVTAALFLTEHPEYSDGYEGRLEPGGGDKTLRERVKDTVENMVLVEVKTERIMGGDRGS
ncbi:hypothetical protein K435DRAFT_792704 [Dendrothele bispora CBS 962.96]|uniref:F-box domain-containing protein n=1 Tax=Dendrothele bispora (strain CBS 962.96) TaxID=1314807 RepID=A0A4S8MHL7_DENBC|nr:hypothetical protein K435DRAFT_792704 [Dendrothele bispora CBS 962.96]